MACDAELLASLEADQTPILHHYGWSVPSLTYGYFVSPFDYLAKEGVEALGLEIARRPTGGGLIFHTCDLAFSFLLPAKHPCVSLNTMENYAFVNRSVAHAVRRFLGENTSAQLLPEAPAPVDAASERFCMAHPTRYDVMLDGRKVGGAAQRRTKYGYLHQGSICLTLPTEEFLARILLPGTQVTEAMQNTSMPLLGASCAASKLTEARQQLQRLLAEEMEMSAQESPGV